MKLRTIKRRTQAMIGSTVRVELKLPLQLIEELRARFRDPEAVVRNALLRRIAVKKLLRCQG